MSEESMQWLNQNTLIGLTAQRGTAWHYRASDQGDESNHYEGFVPVADVERRLFSWNPGERSVAVVLKGKLDNAVTTYFAEGEYWSVVLVEDRKAITRDDTEHVLGVFKNGYTPHDYRTALVDNVGQILSTSNGDLGIGSAGLLRNGGQAWVQVQVPEAIEVGGTSLLPYLTAATSLDGSMSTTYLVGTDVVVCDNTLSAATITAKNKIRLRHSAYSQLRLADAREQLEILFSATEDMVAAVDFLQNVEVSNSEFAIVRNRLDPKPEEKDGSTAPARWDTRQGKLVDLWTKDARVQPWAGTAWGVLMAFNTYGQHEKIFRKTKQTGNRAESNMVKNIQGKLEQDDQQVLAVLSDVLGQQLVATA
jgi:phage/plasmid-like protein (TIGR03299 family)